MQDKSGHRRCLRTVAVDFLLSCCFSMRLESSCMFQIRANPTRVASLFFFFFAFSDFLPGVTTGSKSCVLEQNYNLQY